MLPSTKPPPSPPRPSVRPEYVHILSSPPPPFLPRSLLCPFFLFWALFRLRFSQTREIRMGRGGGKKRAIKRRRLAEKRNSANQGKGVVTNIIARGFERRRRGKNHGQPGISAMPHEEKKEREHFARCPRTFLRRSASPRRKLSDFIGHKNEARDPK